MPHRHHFIDCASNRWHGTTYLPVNIGALNAFKDGERVDAKSLQDKGLAKGGADGIKILGDGELTRKLVVSAHAFSASARAKIEAKGGTCEIVGVKKAGPAAA